mgnify:CR=1 FL=1
MRRGKTYILVKYFIKNKSKHDKIQHFGNDENTSSINYRFSDFCINLKFKILINII